MKALRRNTASGTPRMISPGTPARSSLTRSSVPVYTASAIPMGLPPPGEVRRRVMSLPCQLRSAVPSMGAPLQG